MKNLPKEWQERAERYSEHNSDYNDGYHKGASEMQQAILKIDLELILESLWNGEIDIARCMQKIYKEIQNVKPEK